MPHWRNVGKPKHKSTKQDGVFHIGDRVWLPDGNGCCFNEDTHGEVAHVDGSEYVSVRNDADGDVEECRISCLEHEE